MSHASDVAATGTTDTDPPTTTVPVTSGGGIPPAEELAAPHGPVQPAAPARSGGWRTWRARFVVLVMLGGAVAGGRWLVDTRSAAIAQFDLGRVTLVGQPVSVEPTLTGRVISVDVRAGQQVSKGQRLGTLLVMSTTKTGQPLQRAVQLAAPSPGIISSDPAPVGSTVQVGDPFVQLYDPSKLTLDAAVKVSDLSRLSGGMVATLHADGVDRPVRAVIRRVVPQVTQPVTDTAPLSDQEARKPSRLHLVLVPQHPSEVADLVPGLYFTGTVDTSTRRPDAGSVLQLTR